MQLNPLVVLFTLLALTTQARVVINEIHYHPVEEPAFDAGGYPILDLSSNVHEFVELYNGGPDTDLSGWRISGDVSYTFPSGTILSSNAFLVVARETNRIVNIYGLNASIVFGPYANELPNGQGTVRLRDATNTQVDRVNYVDDEPWPTTADALGAGQSFYPDIDMYASQYKGRSLERVSLDADSSSPANWRASPLNPGPSPGAVNADTRVLPKPIVITRVHMQNSDEAPVIRENETLRVVVQFTDTNTVNSVQLDWWIDDIESFNEPRSTTNMVYLGNAQYSGLITGQANRSIVRYRIRVDYGQGVELVSPRPDGLGFTPVSASEQEAWHGIFIEPTRSSNRPIYDFFVSSASISELTTNSTGSKRVNGTYPRDDPKKGYDPTLLDQYAPSHYPAPSAPHWDGLVWSIFVHEGEVHDIRARFHGSRYRRGVGLNSWKFSFPASRKMQGKQRMLVTEKTDTTVLGVALFAEAGLPANAAQFVDFYRNNDGVTRRCEISDMDEERIRDFQAAERVRRPQNPRSFTGLGQVFKAKGLNGNEGPYGWANGQPMPATGVWNELDRYIHSYASQLNDWQGHTRFRDMMNAVWAARGDGPLLSYPSTYNGTGHGNQTTVSANIPNLRAYLLANWDIDHTLTYLALRNWSKPWDDKFHNWYVYQQGDGKWTLTPWDFDNEQTGDVNESIFAGRKDDTASYSNNSRGPNWFKDNILRAFEAEYKERLFLLNHTLLEPSNVSAIAARSGSAVNATWAQNRHAAINTQLNMGTFERPDPPTPTSPNNNSTALPGSSFTLSPYAHSSGTTNGTAAHVKTIWEIRENNGDFAQPVYYVEQTNALTAMEIPFDELAFGTTYAWRASYVDANGHPSLVSSEQTFTFGTQPTEVTLLSIDAATSWKYNVTESFSNTTSGPDDINWWASTIFDDTAWPSGSALFADETAPLPFPILTPFARAGRMAFYYRTRFTFPGSPSGATLSLRHVVDDGMALYINGVEVPEARFSLPAPPILETQGASPTVGDATLSAPINIPTHYFVPGENVVAVEVHQANNTSSDSVFGLELSGTIPFGSGDVVINEVLADNQRTHEHLGAFPDFIELFNNLFTPVDLGGWSLTDDVFMPYRFVFPTNTMIGPREALLVYAGDAQGTNALYTGFGIDADGQTLALVQDQTVHDTIQFGPQATDYAIGRIVDGETDWGLVTTSPNAPNTPIASLGNVTNLVINEWMANPDGGDDWFELYNRGTNPVALAALYLSDSAANRTLSQVPTLSYIAGRGHTRFDADDRTGANHTAFQLAGAGDMLLLTDADGFTPIDEMSFGIQLEGVSSGRFPDGDSVIVAFTHTASPGESNYLPAPIWINEALANTPAPPLSDRIELFNPGPAAVDLSGWWISDDPSTPDKFTIPPSTVLSNGAYLVFDETHFNPTPGVAPSFSLSSLGDEIVVTGIDGQGGFNGFRSRVNFGASAEYTSFGRVPVLGGTEFWPQLQRSFGQTNGLPKTTPVLINEVHYHPPDYTNGSDNAESEFIELHVHHTQAVDLSGWRLKNTADYIFPTGSVFQAGEYILVVGFNPTNTAMLSTFRTQLGVPLTTTILGPFTPKLPNGEGKIELGRPGSLATLLVDKVAYADQGLWPTAADGGGASLQRQQRLIIGNDPANWIAEAPTPGRVNTGQSAMADSDNDGIPDHWETALQLNPQSSMDAEADDDLDGHSNGSEFRAGTSGSDALDVLRHSVDPSGNDWLISFTAKPDRSYRIWVRDQLDETAWLLLDLIPSAPAERRVSVMDTEANGGRRYYRISTP